MQNKEMEEMKEKGKAEEKSAEDLLEKEAKGYKAVKTQRWGVPGIPEDPNAPVEF